MSKSMSSRKYEALDRLGVGITAPQCDCCGCPIPEFLTIVRIDKTPMSAKSMYSDVMRGNGFLYSIRCSQCVWSESIHGTCSHKSWDVFPDHWGTLQDKARAFEQSTDGIDELMEKAHKRRSIKSLNLFDLDEIVDDIEEKEED